jgi:hypothetical protein
MPKVRTDLPEPTIDFVQSKITQFNHDNEDLESDLTTLIACFPKNVDMSHVLIKVAAINLLYSTQIRAVRKVAEVIFRSGIDPNLESGSDEAVTAIAKVEFNGETRYNYSFATKYCSWHKPELFPIYDSRVDFCLRSYQAKDRFAKTRFTQNDLWDYGKFRRIIEAFLTHYHLESLSFKEVDKFLYQLGNKYFSTPDDAASIAKVKNVGNNAQRIPARSSAA